MLTKSPAHAKVRSVLAYVAGIFFFYLLAGIVLLLGFSFIADLLDAAGQQIGTALESDAGYIMRAIIGVALIAWAWLPKRGAIPAWENRFAVMSWEPFIQFDSVSIAKKVAVPTLIVHSENGANVPAARAFYDGLNIHKELYWMPGSQYDFYDQEPQVTKASHAAAVFFRTQKQ